MSRIGKKPIPLPTGVDVKVAGSVVSVKGPLGKLDWTLKPGIGVTVDKGQVVVTRSSDERKVRAMHGLVRAELNNMVEGVTKGYERNMEITGVGYKAAIQGRTMSFNEQRFPPVQADCHQLDFRTPGISPFRLRRRKQIRHILNRRKYPWTRPHKPHRW